MTRRSDEAPLYVRRTIDKLWHWCSSCPEYPLSVVNSNGVLSTMTKPEGDLCPECIAQTKAGGCAP